MFVLSVMLVPKVDLYIVAIPPTRDRDWRVNDFTSNPLGANSTVVNKQKNKTSMD